MIGAQVVELAPDTLWVHECFPLSDGRHLHVSVYLVRAEDGVVAIDSGSFLHRQSIRARIESVLEGRGLGAVILSHTDYPHSGNVPDFLAQWSGLDIVASCSDAEIQGLPYSRRSRIDQTLDVCGRSFLFLDPPLADRSHTTWIYDTSSRIVFAADGFGNYHAEGECDSTSLELEGGIRTADLDAFHRESLMWLKWVDPPKLARALQRVASARPVEWICPIHGNPIHRTDIPGYLDRLVEAVESIASTEPA